MKLEFIVYVLFALAVFFSFGLMIPAIIAWLIAGYIIKSKIKKVDPEKAKKIIYNWCDSFCHNYHCWICLAGNSN
jgi:hypothetical protein